MKKYKLTLKERLYKKFTVYENGCWIWIGALNGKCGYGMFRLGNKMTTAHRASYIIHYGEIINKSLLVCHTCDTPKCINPSHLFLGTQKQNMADMKRKGRGLNIGKSLSNRMRTRTDEELRLNKNKHNRDYRLRRKLKLKNKMY